MESANTPADAAATSLGPAGSTRATDPAEVPERVATEFIERWSRRDLAYRDWWASVRLLCSPRCREEFAYTDPAVIPSLDVDGAAGAGRIENGVYTVVNVPTTVGTFAVALTRAQAGAWKVSTMTFPDGLGP